MSLLSLGALTVAGYRVRSGDSTTAASAVSAALLESESLMEEALRRDLDLAQRTEKMRIFADGRVYPKAWPITVATLTIDGRSLMGASPDSSPFIGVFDQLDPPVVTLTYTGGFTAATLPVTLRHALYDLAKPIAQGSPSLPTGFTSVSVGDVSLSGGTPGAAALDALVPGLWARVKQYKNRWA